jgi:hypothetical protein
MKIFYHCYGSAHSSVTAANLHLGVLPLTRRAQLSEIAHQPLFDQAEAWQVGLPQYMGSDEWCNQIYVIGLAGGRHSLAAGLVDFLQAQLVDMSQVLLVDALRSASVPLRIGGYTSRRLGLTALGRPLAAWGVWLKYHRYVQHVREIRAKVSRGGGQVMLDCPPVIDHNG